MDLKNGWATIKDKAEIQWKDQTGTNNLII